MASVKDERGYSQGFARSPALEVRTSRRARAILSALEPEFPKRILEVGCGTGSLSYRLASESTAFVVGADRSPSFLDEAAQIYRRPNLEFRLVNLNAEGWTREVPGPFDAIVGNGILHHLFDDLDARLAEFRALLTPNGKLAFWEPNVENPYVYSIFKFALLRRAAGLEPRERAFSRKFILEKLAHAGFREAKAHYRDFLLPNTPRALISYVIRGGDVLERTPLLRRAAQSLFITARV